MIDCQPLDKTMSTIPLPLWASKVNFTLPPPFRTAQISSVGAVWIFSGTTQCLIFLRGEGCLGTYFHRMFNLKKTMVFA